jgi:hypothetical protein
VIKKLPAIPGMKSQSIQSVDLNDMRAAIERLIQYRKDESAKVDQNVEQAAILGVQTNEAAKTL